MNKVKVLYSAMWHTDCHPFEDLGEEIRAAKSAAELTEKDSILIVWGGADINPRLYNHPQSRTTYPGDTRDAVEWSLMKSAVQLGIPIIGVCRGAQMLCALAGGFLIQDTRGHHGHHQITTHEGERLRVNSIHHQMLAGLENVQHEMLAWSTEPLSKGHYIWKDDQVYTPPEGFVEPEFVYFPRVKGFAIQWHPEMMSAETPATTFVLNEINQRLAVTV